MTVVEKTFASGVTIAGKAGHGVAAPAIKLGWKRVIMAAAMYATFAALFMASISIGKVEAVSGK